MNKEQKNKLVPIKKYAVLFSVGALGYGIIEILWRSFTHWTMLIAGGICFLLYYKLCEDEKNMPFLKKCGLGAVIITSVELVFGTIFNVMLKWNVWDYSSLPLNLFGQICIPFFVMWFFLCMPLTFLCKRLRRSKLLK